MKKKIIAVISIAELSTIIAYCQVTEAESQLIYDDNIAVPSDRNNDGIISSGESIRSLVQFKEIFGAGLSYKF